MGLKHRRFWLLGPIAIVAVGLAIEQRAPAMGRESATGTPHTWSSPQWVHPVRGTGYTAAELDRLKYLRQRFPDNPLVSKIFDPDEAEEQRRQQARTDRLAQKMTAGRATEGEVLRYYAQQRRLMRARAHLVDFVLSEPQWTKTILEKYRRIQHATTKQIGELEIRSARSIDLLKERQAKRPPTVYARIGPHATSAEQGEVIQLASKTVPDVVVDSLTWILPTGATSSEATVRISTAGLSPGPHDVLLIATIADGTTSTDVALIDVKPGPPPVYDLAISGLEHGQLPDAAKGAEGRVAVQSVVRNNGTADVAGASVYFQAGNTVLHRVDGIDLKGGESRIIMGPLMAPSSVIDATVMAVVRLPKPFVDEQPANDSLSVPASVSPDPPATEFVTTTLPQIPVGNGQITPPSRLLSDFVGNMLPLPIELGPVDGFADLHIHQMANLGYDARLIWGSHDGPNEESAAPRCSGMGHAMCWLPSPLADIGGRPEMGAHAGLASSTFLSWLLTGGAAPPAYCVDPIWTGGANSIVKGWHSNNTSQRFKDWPVWHTVTHQQVYREWLQEAHNDGLNLIVMSAVSNKAMCSLIPSSKGFGPTAPFDDVIPAGLSPAALAVDRDIAAAERCNDMKNVRRQLLAAWEFDRDHDWYEIALNQGHARQIIQEGKLAVVLSIEAGELFDNPPDLTALLRQFDYFTNDLGVRSIQPLHQTDNVFGGASYFSAIIDLFDSLDTYFAYSAGFLDSDAEAQAGIDAHKGVASNRNASGDHHAPMTTLGIELLRTVMERGLLFDISHLDRTGSNQAYNIARAQNYYPIFASHLRYQDLLWEDAFGDHLAKSWQVLQEIKDLGGMVGLRTTHRRQRSYPSSGPNVDVRVDDTCPGSTRSLAQAYLYGALGMGVPQAFASDMNGFIENTRPRFWDGGHPKYDTRDWACSQNASAGGRNWYQSLQGDRATSGTGTDFDLTGFGRISQIGDLLSDLRDNLGVETVQVENSANAFLDMWARAQFSTLRGPGSRCVDRRYIAGGPATDAPGLVVCD